MCDGMTSSFVPTRRAGGRAPTQGHRALTRRRPWMFLRGGLRTQSRSLAAEPARAMVRQMRRAFLWVTVVTD
jgi:hypothetical protein